jgi:teichoic acid transport system ATP-binding protein
MAPEAGLPDRPDRPEGVSPNDGAVVVRVNDVHVVYRAYEDLRLGLATRLARRQLRRQSRKVHAVRGVSFTLQQGDSLGIMGHNGSGKSTLLAALTGLLPVESGTIEVRSRPTLLGVNAALRPQLSGRRNIELGCLAMGLSPTEVAQHVDPIIEFAGLADFIDLPMQTYSSGMRARLAFSIATSRTPDILLIDEALAVGDEEFRQRSGERIAEIRHNSGAVILVSHNPREVRATCNRVIWMDHGVVRDDGPPSRVVDAYVTSQRHAAGLDQ